LYPKGRVSRLQQEQLRRTADNIYTLEVSGDFDDCQRLVKEAFKDAQLTQKLHLTSANSISIGRLLPQTTYYAAVYGRLNQSNIRMVVPTGNIGNLTAGVLAQRMGVPIARFLAANNANNALYRLAQTGTYEPLRTKQTASNAMDVGAPNNLPRLMRLFDDSVDELRKNMDVSYVNDADTAKTISSVYEQTGYLLDPHTAVAWRASENVPSNGMADVVVSTASPLKFAEEIEKLTGIVVDNSAELEKLLSTAESYSSIEANMDDFANFLEELS
jgi:threonine synthase